MKRNLPAPLLAIALSVVCTVTSLGQNKVGGSVPKESEAIDLGLSVKWAPWNIGASQPSDYGEYFAWGEVSPKNIWDRNWYGYYWCDYYRDTEIDAQPIMSKYNDVDGKSKLETTDDAATANWGDKWRMPTQAEFSELFNLENCEWTWTDNYNGSGNRGYVVKSRRAGYDGAVLFLPAACFPWDEDSEDLIEEGPVGCYWLAELCPMFSVDAICFYFDSDGYDVEYATSRCNVFSVRAVCPPAE